MRRPHHAFLFLAFLLLFLPAACASIPGKAARGPGVQPLPNSENVDLDAADIVCVMRRAGFSDNQILDLGPQLRNRLAEAGAAQIKMGSRTEAIFAVRGDYLHVSSRRTGSFIYDHVKGVVR